MALNVEDHLRCTAIARSTKTRCKRARMDGDIFCEKHFETEREPAMTSALPATVKPEKVEAALVGAARAVGIRPDDVLNLEPVEAMGWVWRTAAGIAEKFAVAIKDVDVTDKATWGVLRMTLDALEATRKAAEAAESAGMQRRRVALKEAEVQATYVAIDRAMQRTGMTEATKQRFVQCLGEELHAMAGT